MVDDLPIVLWWSLLIAGSMTLKASDPRGTEGFESLHFGYP
jgi:hypothetical protein